MPNLVLLVVLAAALLHASWNLLVKRGGVSTRATTAVIYTAAGLLAALMLPGCRRCRASRGRTF